MDGRVIQFKTKEIIARREHVLEAVLYPSFSMLCVQARLFLISPVQAAGQGKAAWNKIIDNITKQGSHVILTGPSLHSYLNIPLSTNTYWVEDMIPTQHGALVVTYLRRIQRAVRSFIRSRRNTAVLMALHPRLGEASPLACLPEHLLLKTMLMRNA
jgi:hypothetical protein